MLARVPRVFLDTSFLVALHNTRDPYHQRAVELDEEFAARGARLLFHLGILLEVGDGFSRGLRRNQGSALLDLFATDSAYELYPFSDDLLAAAIEMFGRHKDKDWGLTDCLSFEIMRREGIDEALTADAHFVQAGYRALLLG